MSSRVYLNGVEDLENQLLGTLRVGSIASRSGGVVRWNISCERCGVRGVMPHTKLRDGYPCPNGSCGRNQARDAQDETLGKFRRRAEAAEAAKRAAIERELAANHGKLNATIRDRILHGKDDELFISPELKTASMTQSEANRFNRQQADIFVRSVPEWNERFAGPENLNILGAYFDRNGVAITDYPTIKAAFERLRDCSALTEKEPVSISEPQQQTVIPEPQPSETTERTDGLLGWDPATGEERFFSNYEIDRMSAEAYKRAFRITRDKLTIRRQW